MKKAKFSIITCTYNPKAEYLDRALESLEKQTFKNFEHIINDSYSNRITTLLLQDYIKRNKDKYPIKFFQSKPKGVAKALNDASKHASGEIIHFLHSDDYYHDKNSLKRAGSYFTKGTNWISGNFIFSYHDKEFNIPITKLIKLNPKRLLSTFTFISHENTFMKTELIKKYGGFAENVKGPVELRLWIRMIQKEKLKLVDDVFTVFTVHKGSTSRGGVKNALLSIREGLKIAQDEGTLPLSSSIRNITQVKKTLQKLIDYVSLNNSNNHD